MRRQVVSGAIGLLLLGGCCDGLKSAVQQHASAMQQNCQTAAELTRRCQAGDKTACPAATASYEAVCQSVQPILDDVSK